MGIVLKFGYDKTSPLIKFPTIFVAKEQKTVVGSPICKNVAPNVSGICPNNVIKKAA
tara:strand:- start:90484 stop:90654 length:171 start_codon:yes stop_codon:yes gene_type:complete